MVMIKRAQCRGSGIIITADLRTGFIDVTVKDLSIPVKECAALYMYADIGKDNVSKPADIVAPHMGNNIESFLFFPSLYIFLGNVGDHIYMAAGAALQAAYGRVLFQCSYSVKCDISLIRDQLICNIFYNALCEFPCICRTVTVGMVDNVSCQPGPIRISFLL